MSKVYLDYNGTTPLAPEVMEEICYAMKYLWGNPSSTYDIGMEARKSINKSRQQVANMIGSSAKEIIFTSGGTESNNMLLNAVADEFRSRSTVAPHFITSVFEHDSIMKVLMHLEQQDKIKLTKLQISPQTGSIDIDELFCSLTRDTVLVTIMLANNETGIIQPLKEISEAVRSYSAREHLRHKILIHSDAAQAFGKMTISVDDLGVDYLTIVGHKFYGPRIGALYVRDLGLEGQCERSQVPIRPLVLGGGQERDLRSGTENTPMIVGLGKASELVTMNIEKYEDHMRRVRDHLEKYVIFKFQGFGCRILSRFPKETCRLSNTCCVALATNFDITGPQILARCKRLQASVGSACHSDKASATSTEYSGSRVLRHCGYSASECRSAVRLSVGRNTTESEVEAAVDDLFEAVSDCLMEK